MTMMLVEAVCKGLIKEGDYINYNPDYRKHILLKGKTGYDENQIVETEEFKYQLAGIIYGQIILVADGVSSKEIFLEGMKGHKKGPEALQEYMQKCYSSKKLKSRGLCLTEPIFEKLLEKMKDIDNRYWLASHYVEFFSGYVYFGLRCASNTNIGYNCLASSRDSTGNIHLSGVRPAVILPSDIMIDENKKLMPYEGWLSKN